MGKPFKMCELLIERLHSKIAIGPRTNDVVESIYEAWINHVDAEHTAGRLSTEQYNATERLGSSLVELELALVQYNARKTEFEEALK